VYGSCFATHRFLHRTSGTNTSGTSNNTVPVLVPVTSGSNSDTTAVSDGGDFGVFPIYPVHGWPRGAIVNALLYLDADIAIHTQVVLSVHGTARTYRALGTALAQTPSGSINTNLRMLLRAD
jgi:hypothetical protein